MVEELFPDISLKSQNGVYLWIHSLTFYTVFLYCMVTCGLSKYSETKLQTTCFLPFIKLFKKTRSILELVSLPHFVDDILLYFIN